MVTKPHPSFQEPADRSISLWRYMNLGRFISILQNKSLYHKRIDSFDNPFEGYHTKALIDNIEENVDIQFSEFKKEEIINLVSEPLQRDKVRKMLQVLIDHGVRTWK